MGGYLDRAAILAADDITYRDVPVPEWGGTVRVRALTGAERDRYEQSMVEERGRRRSINLANARAKLVALAVVDEHGTRTFSQDDVDALGRKSAGALSRVWDAARELSGLSDQDVDELVEDFDDAPNGASGSD